MKTTTLILFTFLIALGIEAQTPPAVRPTPQPIIPSAKPPPAFPRPPASTAPAAPAASPAPAAAEQEQMIPAGDINFQGVDVDQVLDVYARYVGRTMLRAGLPTAKIILQTETPLTKTEVIQALQGVLALNGIALINIGDKFVKAVPIAQAFQEGEKFNSQSAAELPDLGQFVTHIVQLKYVQPSKLAPVLQTLAKSPNAVYPIDDNNIIILRDYAENVKRMLEFIKQVDVMEPEEFVSEVIPIKYALATDIANALNSLGTGGGSVTIGGTSAGASQGRPNLPGTGGTPFGGNSFGGTPYNGNSFGGTPYGGNTGYNPMSVGDPTPLSAKLNEEANATYKPMALDPPPGNTFSERLRNIINQAANSANGQIQILGPTKIIADQRSNSLLIFASRQDMATITNIVAKLDVLLPQVLIQSIIFDITLNNGWNFGVSVAQNPKNFSGGTPPNTYSGAGGYNNGQSFFNFAANTLGSNAGSAFIGNSLQNGLSYFGNLGPTWDVALEAAANDSEVTVVQRPSIQTFQAQPASFFVGQSVPYVQNSYYGYTGGTAYSYLNVGIGLTVTPFINPSGLVVMQISQQISDIASLGNSTIQAPTTDTRTITSEVACKSGDTIMLGGYITTNNSKGRSGVPILQDIPILGNLFSSRTSSKQRTELVVLMHPVVLNTPDEASAEVGKQVQRLPGVSQAMSEDKMEEQKEMEKVQKQLRKERAKEQNENSDSSETVNQTNVLATPSN